MHSLMNESAVNSTAVDKNESYFSSRLLTPFVAFFKNEDFHAILGGVVGFWGGVFGLGVIFLLLVAFRFEKWQKFNILSSILNTGDTENDLKKKRKIPVAAKATKMRVTCFLKNSQVLPFNFLMGLKIEKNGYWIGYYCRKKEWKNRWFIVAEKSIASG